MAEWRVASDGLVLAWQRRGWPAASDSRGEVHLSDPQADSLCRSLSGALSAHAQRGDTLRLVLGSQYMRVAALPWPPDRLDATEKQALLRQRWEERLDDVSDWWTGVEASGAIRLATAVRKDLLRALEATVSGTGVRPRACLPAAGLALRHGAAAGDSCIHLGEGQRTTTITLREGRLTHLSSAWRNNGQSRSGTDLATVTLDGGPKAWLDWL